MVTFGRQWARVCTQQIGYCRGRIRMRSGAVGEPPCTRKGQKRGKLHGGLRKLRPNYLQNKNKNPTFATAKQNGTLTEWLGSGLQNRVQQFESARYLYKAEHFLRSAPLF